MWGVGSRYGQSVDILTQRGTIWSVGYNNGDGAGSQQQAGTALSNSQLKEVLHPYAFVDVAKSGYQQDSTNSHATYALDVHGDIYIWGSGNYERGAGNDSEDMYVPTQIKF
jgi:alpha-tubulin suppressor-like RCC1 family protein